MYRAGVIIWNNSMSVTSKCDVVNDVTTTRLKIVGISLLAHELTGRGFIHLFHGSITKCWVNATVVELTSYLTGGAVEATPVGQAVTARAGWETELLSQARPVATGIEEAASRPCLEATKQQTS
jgi:hypothetical protein